MATTQMMKTALRRTPLALAALLTLGSALTTDAAEPIRIDGSSTEATERSFQQMTAALTQEQQIQLMMAMVQLNFVGVTSATEAISNPALQQPSAGRIKDKITGMTASEIIDLANRTATTQAFVQGKEPGVPSDLLRPLQAGSVPQSLAGTTWVITSDVNGHVREDVYAFHEDHTGQLVETDRKSPGIHRWEQSGIEMRLSTNDGYSVFLGHFKEDGSMVGEAGNEIGTRWTWIAEKH
jgi:hypothetical protein